MRPENDLVQVTQDDPRWSSFLESCTDATIFHHPAWARLMVSVYGYRPSVGMVIDGSGEAIAGLPLLEVRSWLTGHRAISLPFSDYCPPLARNADGLMQLATRLDRMRNRRDLAYIDVRGEFPPLSEIYPVSAGVRHVLPLQPDCDRVFHGFNRSAQKNIRKGQRDGVQVRICTSHECLAAFYHLQLLTRRRLGVPVQPKRFYAKLWAELIETGLGFVVLASIAGRPIAGGVFLTWNNTITHKYTASDSDYWQHRPIDLIVWTAIQWGCTHGYHHLDFGRTDLVDLGLRDFKKKWGAAESPLVYSFFCEKPPKREAGLLKRAVAMTIRRSPLFVCRALGELLYGHFA